MTSLNQKEYLKKYLAIGKMPGDKKKKKKQKTIRNRLKIIDDDADVNTSQEIQDDIAAANEDAPQIVAVIDERPPSLRVDDETKSKLWKPIGESEDVANVAQTLKPSTSFKLNKQVQNSRIVHTLCEKHKLSNYKGSSFSNENSSSRKNIKRQTDSSPKRKESYNFLSRSIKLEPSSPLRKDLIGDDSLPKKRSEDYSPPTKINKDSSPPRRSKKNQFSVSPRRPNKEDDSFPRNIHKNSSISEDCGPPQGIRNKGINLPPRNIKEEDNSPPRIRNEDENISCPRRRKQENNFPPNKGNAGDCNYYSPPRNTSEYGDNSPRIRNKDDDSSPPRRHRYEDNSPPRSKNRSENNSPYRKNRHMEVKQKKSRWGQWSPDASSERPKESDEKMKKTLDGKKAGLQNAKDLVEETTLLRHRENHLFKNMSAEMSGINAATVVRGKKVRDFEAEAQQQKKENVIKEKYVRWGKGLKQVEDKNEKLAEQLHEMSKPLARYADDQDLEKYLKEQERDGDPMLAYIRKQKKKEAVVAGIPEKPMYMGEFMPNRFGIRPGYRWDGVDRSNSYEKKWFQVQNSRKATQEEAFKWSTEDM